MIMFCSNQNCDFQYDDIPASAALVNCPKCGGRAFQSPKFGLPFYMKATIEATTAPYTFNNYFTYFTSLPLK